MKTVLIAACAVGALSLAACNKHEDQPLPQGSAVGAAMPDTAAPRAPDATMTAPDAGTTGTVPADGSAPAVAATPSEGTAGGQPASAPPR